VYTLVNKKRQQYLTKTGKTVVKSAPNVKNTFTSHIDKKNIFDIFVETLSLYILIQPTISLEMSVPSQGHYGFHSFPVVD
jgi:hypothetical protein